MNTAHVPVLLKSLLHQVTIKDNSLYLDCTFGAGGYSRAILEVSNSKLYALDRDEKVSIYAKGLQEEFGDRFRFILGDFGNLEDIANNNFFEDKFDGIFFDLGISSMQIDIPDRGFSFYKDGPLDMRMDNNQALKAADLVNNYPEEELANIISQFGGEKKAKIIARAIVNYREKNKSFSSTLELAGLIKKIVGKYNDSIHPATRTFQALRIVVNDELEQIKKGLKAAINLLKKDGILAVISFHSEEDVIVKHFFNSLISKSSKKNKYELFSKNQEDQNSACRFELLFKGPITPDIEELESNIRARSAKLRILRSVI